MLRENKKRKRTTQNREIEDAPASKRQGRGCVIAAALLEKKYRTRETGIIEDTSETKHPRSANKFDIAVQPDYSGVATAAPSRATHTKSQVLGRLIPKHRCSGIHRSTVSMAASSRASHTKSQFCQSCPIAFVSYNSTGAIAAPLGRLIQKRRCQRCPVSGFSYANSVSILECF